MTFARACGHITNYTSGHETGGLVFPDWHIEVDNRLSWLVGSLAENYPDSFYVHLVRDRDTTIRSFVRRHRGGVEMPLLDVLGGAAEVEDAAAFYVDCCTANIREFLRDKERMTVQIESPAFAQFWVHIGAEGDYRAAFAEFRTRYNR